MRIFAQLDRSNDPCFCIIHELFVGFLARQVHLDVSLQLIIP